MPSIKNSLSTSKNKKHHQWKKVYTIHLWSFFLSPTTRKTKKNQNFQATYKKLLKVSKLHLKMMFGVLDVLVILGSSLLRIKHHRSIEKLVEFWAICPRHSNKSNCYRLDEPTRRHYLNILLSSESLRNVKLAKLILSCLFPSAFHIRFVSQSEISLIKFSVKPAIPEDPCETPASTREKRFSGTHTLFPLFTNGA